VRITDQTGSLYACLYNEEVRQLLGSESDNIKDYCQHGQEARLNYVISDLLVIFSNFSIQESILSGFKLYGSSIIRCGRLSIMS
jgi:hypothetical protein